MNASDLTAFSAGDLSGAALQANIGPEVEKWTARLSERGRSAAIVLRGMDQPFDITPKRAVRFLDSYIANEMLPASFAYVLDALLLEERFRWTSVAIRDAMESVLGEEYPPKMDKRRAWEARAELKALGTPRPPRKGAQ